MLIRCCTFKLRPKIALPFRIEQNTVFVSHVFQNAIYRMQLLTKTMQRFPRLEPASEYFTGVDEGISLSELKVEFAVLRIQGSVIGHDNHNRWIYIGTC